MSEQHLITRIIDGKALHQANLNRIFFTLNGKMAHITVKEHRPSRSNSQNKYYWGVVLQCVVQVLEHYGNEADTEDAHEFCKQKFMPADGVTTLVGPKGTVKIKRSTTKLSKQAFIVYLDRIIAWAAEHGMQIPSPDEYVRSEG